MKLVLSAGTEVSDKAAIPKPGSKASNLVSQIYGCHLLVVEDNEINLELVLALLDDVGITTTVASDGQQALDALEEEQFDAVLMDVQMPVMDGLTATREIRQQSKFAGLPIIALTAGGMEKDKSKKEALDAGMNDHIAKPISANDLYVMMVKWIVRVEGDEANAVRVGQSEQSEKVALPEIDGINTKIGLGVCNGNRALYLRLLTMFTKEVDFIDRFNKAVKADDMATAQCLVHSLKGTAGNIGAQQVQTAALALERVIRDGRVAEEIALCQADVAKVLNPVVSALQRFSVSQQRDASLVAVNPKVEALSPLFRQLSELLSDNDTEAIEKLDDIKVCLEGSVYETELALVVKRVERYEFEAALIALHRLASAIGIVV